MEMKDKLKKLRKDRGLTQAQLAEALFVSRSTVAKWENGLGLPGQESLQLLEQLYGVSREEVSTTAPEAIIVAKNRKLHTVGQIIGWSVFLLITILSLVIPIQILKGNYGFTPEMAAGLFADNPYIDTGDYRIYYTTFSGTWEDGQHWEMLSSLRPVEKHFWGWTVSEEDHHTRVITKNNYVVGRLTSIQGKNGCYNIIGIQIAETVETELVTLQSVNISGVSYDVQHSFFFITPEPVEYFKIGDVFFNVE